MRIRVSDLTDLFGPPVHLRMLEQLDPLSVDEMMGVRELWLQLTRLAEGDPLVGDDAEIVFGGAIVLTLPRSSRSGMFEALVIDGRRRIIAWQLVLDACRRSMDQHGAAMVARSLDALLNNPANTAFSDAQRHVVRPSRGDRDIFVDRLTLDLRLLHADSGRTSGIAFAHAWLLDAAHTWLEQGDQFDRAQRLARVLLRRVRVVVIEARAEENPLRIARQFTSGEVKAQVVDIVDQMLLDSAALTESSIERVYESFVHPLSDSWWRETPDARPRSEARHEQFLRAWTMAQTLREIDPDDLVPAFSKFMNDSGNDVIDLLARLRIDLLHLRQLLQSAHAGSGSSDPRAQFLYRMSVLGCAKAIAVLVWLDRAEQAAVPEHEKLRVLAMVESWVVRRALGGLPYAGVWLGIQPLFDALASAPRAQLSDRLHDVMATIRTDETYWPTDDDVRMVLPTRQFAREMPESAARVILEALVERADDDTTPPRFDQRVLLREQNPGDDTETSPLLRHVLANLILEGALPTVHDAVDITQRNDLLVEQCIRLWPGPAAATSGSESVTTTVAAG